MNKTFATACLAATVFASNSSNPKNTGNKMGNSGGDQAFINFIGQNNKNYQDNSEFIGRQMTFHNN